MAIAFGAIGAKATTGITTLAIAYPASPGAGDMAVAARAVWNAVGHTATDEAGWTNSGDPFGGNAGGAVDNHKSRARADVRQLDGTESGSVTFDQAALTNGACGVMARYTKAATEVWQAVQSTTGDDATHGADRAIAASGTLDLAPGDMVPVVVASGTDAALTITSPVITAPGITFGATTQRTSGAGSADGQDGNVELFDAVVTSGSGTVTPSIAFTTATSQSGPAVFLRLRAVDQLDLTPAAETDAAVAVGRSKSRGLTAATETETAVPIGRLKSRTLTPATETDAAVAITASSPGHNVTLTPSTETDSAVAIGRLKMRTLTPATETDAGITVARSKARTVAAAAETSAAVPVVRQKARGLAPAVESDQAVGVGRSKLRALVAALETAAAVILGRLKSRTIGTAVEIDQAVPIPIGGVVEPVPAESAATTVAPVTSVSAAAASIGSADDVSQAASSTSTAEPLN